MALVVAVAACGAVVAALTVGTFSALNVASISLPALGGWFAADVVAFDDIEPTCTADRMPSATIIRHTSATSAVAQPHRNAVSGMRTR